MMRLLPEGGAEVIDSLAEIQRKARQAAEAMRSGWPVRNPYFRAGEATEWQKQFDLALAAAKVNQK